MYFDLDAGMLLSLLFGENRQVSAQFFGVSRGSIDRWIRENKLPEYAQQLILHRHFGDLSRYGELWQGWRITEAGLIAQGQKRMISIEQLTMLIDYLHSPHVTRDFPRYSKETDYAKFKHKKKPR